MPVCGNLAANDCVPVFYHTTSLPDVGVDALREPGLHFSVFSIESFQGRQLGISNSFEIFDPSSLNVFEVCGKGGM